MKTKEEYSIEVTESIGKSYYYLTILDSIRRNGILFAVCKCECGTIKDIRHYDVVTGGSKSCGCRQHKHLLWGTHIYRIYRGMIQRCTSSKSKDYARYGARGITMPDSWIEDIHKMILDIGYPPSKDHSIDRIDNDKGYSKENCRWATRYEQQANKHNNKVICFGGIRKIQAEWARDLCLSSGYFSPYQGVEKKQIRKVLFKRGLKFLNTISS